jgi:hypothetical protein
VSAREDVVERIRVTFEGDGAGVAEPTWGQRELWGVGGQEGRAIAMGGVTPLPPGMTVDDTADVLRYIMGRHQTLRTRFRLDPRGRLHQQVLYGSGDIALEVYDAEHDTVDGNGDGPGPGPGADPEALAHRVTVAYERAEFDCVHDWPVRMAVIRRRGTPTHAVAVYNHLAIDAYGLDALLADLADRDPVTGLAGRPVAAAQPLDQARWQASPAGRRQSDLALRHWERLLRTVPTRRFADRPGGPDPDSRDGSQYRQVVLNSPAADLAARIIAVRTGLDTASVLLAAFAIAVARLTGVNPTAAQVVVGNRFRPGLATSVSTVNQMGLCAIDTTAATTPATTAATARATAGAAFDEVAARAWRASLHAYKNAYYDPVGRHELITAVGRDRGEPVTVDCFYNDRRRRRGRPGDDGPPPSAEDLRAALDRGRLTWQPWEFGTPVGETLYLHIDDSPGSIDFTLCGDADHVEPAALESCVRGLEEILVDAAAVSWCGPGRSRR